jgi:hypothetical protein
VLVRPRVEVVPPCVRSEGSRIVAVAAMAGIRLDETQAMVAEAIGGVGADDRWSAYEACVYCPRQNLKTELAISRLLWGLLVAREDYQMYSSCMVPSATKMHRRLLTAIDRSPRLAARIGRKSSRRGSESVELTTGQTIECVARSGNSGRGFTGSTVIFDEAHDVDADQLGAMLPTLSAVKNPQVIYLLSLADERSLHMAGVRARALVGEPGIAWLEWSMDPDDDVADRRVWQRANPAVAAGRIRMEFLESEYRAMGREIFAREHLGKSTWPTGAPGDWAIVDEGAWMACAAPGVQLEDPDPVQPVNSDHRREFDPFERWGASGVPPWVSRGAITGAGVGLWECRCWPWLPVLRPGPAYTGGCQMDAGSFIEAQHADLSAFDRVQALTARDDALAAVQEKRAEAERAEVREARLEALEFANRLGGDPVGELQRARAQVTDYDDEVRDLTVRLEKAQAKLTRAQGNMEFWSKRMGEVTGAVSRSVSPDDLLGPAKAALKEHREYVAASRAAWSAVQSGAPRARRPKGEVSRGGEVRRSELECVYCVENNVNHEDSTLLHLDPQYGIPITSATQAAQAREADRLRKLGYSDESARLAATPVGREIVR